MVQGQVGPMERSLPLIPWPVGSECLLQLLMEIWALYPSKAGLGVLPKIQREAFAPLTSFFSLLLGSEHFWIGKKVAWA